MNINERTLQIRRTHLQAQPTEANPAWMNSHRDCGHLLGHIDSLVMENANLRFELEEAAKLLSEAASDIESWGTYAIDYFQQKHDLAGVIAETRQHAARIATIAKNDGGQHG